MAQWIADTPNAKRGHAPGRARRPDSILLRDPLQLTDKTLLVPQPLAPVLVLCDGTREDASALSASLAVRYGLRISPASSSNSDGAG